MKINLEKESDGQPLVMIWTTVADSESALELADEMVRVSLAACVQIDGPVRSYYRWKDQIEETAEYRLVIKTRASRADELGVWLVKNHPYDEPEILITPILAASPGYHRWVIEQTSIERP